MLLRGGRDFHKGREGRDKEVERSSLLRMSKLDELDMVIEMISFFCLKFSSGLRMYAFNIFELHIGVCIIELQSNFKVRKEMNCNKIIYTPKL